MEWIIVDISFDIQIKCAKCKIPLASIKYFEAYMRTINSNNELICSLIFNSDKIEKSLIQQSKPQLTN
jgi:hypothetical protein